MKRNILQSNAVKNETIAYTQMDLQMSRNTRCEIGPHISLVASLAAVWTA